MTMKKWILVGAALAIGASVAPKVFSPTEETFAQEKTPPPSREAMQYSYSPIVKKAAPAVVNVYVRSRVQTFDSPFANDPFFRHFFGNAFGHPSERVLSSLGSGVIVAPEGLVVTNTHVIKGGSDAA
ncbi:MAG: serine protease, partial [Hyphomicrobium sp.]